MYVWDCWVCKSHGGRMFQKDLEFTNTALHIPKMAKDLSNFTFLKLKLDNPYYQQHYSL